MTQMHECNREYLAKICAEGVLEEVEPASMDLSDGVIMITCADADQFVDYYSHIALISKSVVEKDRTYVLALNGGAFLLSGSWPSQRESEILKSHIEEAVKEKNIQTIILYGHISCGAAGMCGLDVPTALYHLAEAKDVAKSINDNVKVICFLHVDEGSGRKTTYHFSRDKYRAEK